MPGVLYSECIEIWALYTLLTNLHNLDMLTAKTQQQEVILTLYIPQTI